MKYRIRHTTTYKYETAASVSYNVLYLFPRATDRQILVRNRALIQPNVVVRSRRADIFGNTFEVIAVQSPHRMLKISTDSTVNVNPVPFLDPASTPAWEVVRDGIQSPADEENLLASEFAFESPLVPKLKAAALFAGLSFPKHRPILDGAMDLMGRIHNEFHYNAGSTTVSTPVSEVFESRLGVCQDFAHVMLSCLRSVGLAARYVSGYLETNPPPGKERLTGADASHAWVSVFVPRSGWIDLDPTNNILPSERHLTLSWGRDYRDVVPVRGVVLGGGPHTLEVAVDIKSIAD